MVGSHPSNGVSTDRVSKIFRQSAIRKQYGSIGIAPLLKLCWHYQRLMGKVSIAAPIVKLINRPDRLIREDVALTVLIVRSKDSEDLLRIP